MTRRVQTSRPPRLRRLIRLLGVPLRRPLAGPRTVSLEISHHCNLRCSFCESHGARQALPITARRTYAGGRTQLDLATLRRLAVELAAAGTDGVELSGKGDPIAHPELAEIVTAIKRAGLACSLITNGTLARPPLAALLVAAGLDRLSVSINAGSRATYHATHKRDLWDRAIGFLRRTIAERERLGRARPEIAVSHVLTRENLHELEAMAEIAVDLGLDRIRFSVLGELPETAGLQLTPAEARSIHARAPAVAARLEAERIEHNLPAFLDELSTRLGRRAHQQENRLQRTLPCYEGWNFSVIGPDGTVYPCCYCEERKLGNIHERSFGEIWRGPAYRAYRREALQIPRRGRYICRECFRSCNRAVENLRIDRRLHPFRRALR